MSMKTISDEFRAGFVSKPHIYKKHGIWFLVLCNQSHVLLNFKAVEFCSKMNTKKD